MVELIYGHVTLSPLVTPYINKSDTFYFALLTELICTVKQAGINDKNLEFLQTFDVLSLKQVAARKSFT